MSNNNEQNGRQPQPTTPPSDPRIRKVSTSEQQRKICRDYVWGICSKGTQCKFRHEFDVNSMKTILKFCHDYQNRTGCTRPDCTYLHTTREEQNLFLSTGQIPRALAERHAAMTSTPINNMYGNEYIAQAPPPPPPPPPPHTGVAPPPPHTAAAPPPPHTAAAPPPPPPAPLPPILAPPPPPPPPPPPSTTTSAAPVRTVGPQVFSGPPPFSTPTMFPVAQPPPLPIMFDASRPPPPLPTNTIPKKNGALKRSAEPSNAGPSKVRKPESSKLVERLCETCIQRELRIELYRKEMQKLECEREYQSYIYEKKSEGYENGRLLLKSVVSAESFRILDEYIEGSTQMVQVHDLLAQFNQTSSFVSGTSTVPRQFLLQLMDCVFSNSRNMMSPTHIPSVGMDESTLLHSLSALTRISNPINNTSVDMIQAVLGVLRNSNTMDRNSTIESRSNDKLSLESSRPSTSSTVNGFSHFLNGQKVDNGATTVAVASTSRNVAARPYLGASRTAALPPAAPSAAPAPHAPAATHAPSVVHSAPAPSQTPSAPRAAPAPNPPSAPHPIAAPHRPGISHANAHTPNVRPVAAPPSAYLPYQPAVAPPPNRPYYPQTYPAHANHIPNINAPYSNSVRMGVTPQVPARPATSATAPPAQNTQKYNPYVGRYPSQPHYYPPFQ